MSQEAHEPNSRTNLKVGQVKTEPGRPGLGMQVDKSQGRACQEMLHSDEKKVPETWGLPQGQCKPDPHTQLTGVGE